MLLTALNKSVLTEWILALFAKMRKATIIFVMSLSVCPSVRLSVRLYVVVCVQQQCSHWTDFHEILYLIILGKFVKNIQVSLKSDKNYRLFTYRTMCALIISR
jgi:hypothetical protein